MIFRFRIPLVFLVLLFLGGAVVTAQSRINPEEVTIARDTFGVPHIFAPTDAGAAYGLAWAHAEDDFEHVQHALLGAKAMLGRVKGPDGVLFDYAVQAFGIDSLVENGYEAQLSPEYKRVLEGYCQGLNDFAASHPKEVLLKKGLPFRPQDVVKGYVLSGSLMAGLGMSLKAVRENRIREYYYANDNGSNAVAVAPDKMEDGLGYLLLNSHQPNEGQFAWYEAHVQSEEGWDIVGGLFPGGASIFVGTNRNLGWAHTNNYHSFGDIYQLEINPKNKRQYRYDGEWRNFRERTLKLVVKVAGIRIPIRKKARWTEYGPVLKTKQGVWSFRFPGYTDLRSAEQWFRMNKAKNLEEFELAMQMQAAPMFNVIYADREGNIFLHSGGRIPKRDPGLNWRHPITENTSDYKWEGIVPYDQLPMNMNPECGFVYNSNNTPLHASGDSCEWEGSFPGLQRFGYNRGDVFGEVLNSRPGQFSEDFLMELKFNTSYASDGSYMAHFDTLYHLDPERYPDLEEAIAKVKRWNLRGDRENPDAALLMVAHDYLRRENGSPFALLMIRERKVREQEAVEALRYAQRLLRKHYGTLEVPLGEVQRLIRGGKSLPISGLREVPRAADTKYLKKGIFKVKGGDCYIQVVRWSPEGPQIRSVNTYGSSSRPESPHYTDQMELFADHRFKPVTLDKTEILRHAERVYSPGK